MHFRSALIMWWWQQINHYYSVYYLSINGAMQISNSVDELNLNDNNTLPIASCNSLTFSKRSFSVGMPFNKETPYWFNCSNHLYSGYIMFYAWMQGRNYIWHSYTCCTTTDTFNLLTMFCRNYYVSFLHPKLLLKMNTFSVHIIILLRRFIVHAQEMIIVQHYPTDMRTCECLTYTLNVSLFFLTMLDSSRSALRNSSACYWIHARKHTYL